MPIIMVNQKQRSLIDDLIEELPHMDEDELYFSDYETRLIIDALREFQKILASMPPNPE